MFPRTSIYLALGAFLTLGCGIDSSGAESGVPDCPMGMVPVAELDEQAAFCIDFTEVPVASYDQIIDSGHVPDEVEGCLLPDPFTGSDWFSRTTTEPSPGHPTGGISWCQARAYCSWRGARLCGASDGPSLLMSTEEIERRKPGQEWVRACSGNGRQRYSYSNAFSSDACQLALTDGGRVGSAPAGSTPTCEGGVSGLYDMSGSLWEWSNMCVVRDGTRACLAFGGAATAAVNITPITEGAGACLQDSRVLLDAVTPVELDWPELGFRCCTDLPKP